MTLADRIVVLRDGRVEQIGRPLDLYDDPANQFVAGFVGSPRMNFLAAEVVARDGPALTLALVNQGGARLTLPVAGRRRRRPAGGRACGPSISAARARATATSSWRSTWPSTWAPPATSTPTPRSASSWSIEREESRAEVGLDRLTVSIPARQAYLFDAAGARLKCRTQTMERQGETTVATKLRWGILGPGTIARTFAGGVAHSRTGTLVAIGARDPGQGRLCRGLPRRAGARRLRGAARRPRGRGGLHRHAAPAPCRVGDQGGRGRQARAGREADRADRATRPTRSSTPRGGPAPSWPRPSCTGCTRRPRSSSS